MKILAQYITRKSRGGIAVREAERECEVVRLGRGTDCEIQLMDPRILLEHAKISVRKGTVYIEAVNGGMVSVNGTLVQTNKVSELDEVEVGPFQIILQQTKGDSDITLSIELVSPLGDELVNLKKLTSIGMGNIGLSKRAWSWSMFVVVFVAFLIWPMVMSWITVPSSVNVETAQTANIGVNSTAIWTSGGISNAHKFFGEGCDICHEEPFIQVQDKACLSCHLEIEHHADPVKFLSASFNDVSCQHCHKEHQGDETIARNDQGFCVGCHGTLPEDEPNTSLIQVSDFGAGHPEFRPSVVIDPALHEVSRAVAMNDSVPPQESSGLSFPHADHLLEAGVHHPQRGNITLECNSCHEADDGGVSMLPIAFEKHCHQCHELTFDTQLPDREMIHGRPEELFKQISDIYDAAAMRGGYKEAEAPAIIRRRPGTPLTVEERDVARNWAEEKTASILNGRFGRGQCDECHRVFDNGQDGEWVIEPVEITEQWFPKSVFSHNSHSEVGCIACHATETSITSSDVLMPSIAVCQSCHGGETATDRVPSTCITCHQFHIDDLGPMRPAQSAAASSHREFAVIRPGALPRIAGVAP